MNPSNLSPSPSSTSSLPAAESASDLKTNAVEKARQLRDAAASTFTRAKEETARLATEKKSAAADRVGGYGSAIHETARNFEEKDPNIAWIAHRTADRVDQIADYIRSRDLRGLRDDAEDLARRHPAVFFGGLFLAGVVVGNLVKASRRNGSDLQGLGQHDEDWSDRPASETGDVPASTATPAGEI